MLLSLFESQAGVNLTFPAVEIVTHNPILSRREYVPSMFARRAQTIAVFCRAESATHWRTSNVDTF